MPDFYTEEDAEQDPSVLIHKAKLKATTEELERRKAERGKSYYGFGHPLLVSKREEGRRFYKSGRPPLSVKKEASSLGGELAPIKKGVKKAAGKVKEKIGESERFQKASGRISEKLEPVKERLEPLREKWEPFAKKAGPVARTTGRGAKKTFKVGYKATRLGVAAAQKVEETVAEKLESPAGRKLEGTAVSILTAPLHMFKGRQVTKLAKPVHPDKLLKNKELYFGTGVPDEVTPLGRPITDWRELYFGTGPVKKDAAKVLNAMMSGASDIESITVYTGLNETKIKGALRFLKQQGHDVEVLEGG